MSVGCSNSSSLGTYTRSIRYLVPGEVGNYKFEKIYDTQQPHKFKKYFENLPLTDYALADYKQANATGHARGEIILIACKTPSSETALRILQRINDDYYSGPAVKGTDNKEAKRKGVTVVGSRTELARDQPVGRVISVVVWTNGSVVFVLYPVVDRVMNDDLLAFENAFPY